MLFSTRSSHPKCGRWTIFATCVLMFSLSACQVSPTEISGELLELDPRAATLAEGDTLRIQALSANGHGAASLNPSKQVTWESSDPGVAFVEEGLIRAIGSGEARITAISRSGARASMNITVGSDGMSPAFPGAEGWGARRDRLDAPVGAVCPGAEREGGPPHNRPRG